MNSPFVIEVSPRNGFELFEQSSLATTPASLDDEIFEAILEQAETAPRGSPMKMVFRPAPDSQPADSLREFFTFRAETKRREIRRIFDSGCRATLIGMCFLTVATAVGELIRHSFPGGFLSNVANGLEIFGWVALWRPAELLLYEWVPVYRQRLLLKRLAQATVESRSA
jgi:hypothetical protein